MNFVQAVQGLIGRIYTVTSSVVTELVHFSDTFIQNYLNCFQYTVDQFIHCLGIKLMTLGHLLQLR